jgi:hypothetical protein
MRVPVILFQRAGPDGKDAQETERRKKIMAKRKNNMLKDMMTMGVGNLVGTGLIGATSSLAKHCFVRA